MKLLFFDDYKFGVVKGTNVVDVTAAVPNADVVPPQDQMERVIAGFASFKPKFEAIVEKEAGVPMSGVRLRAPLPRPHNSMCAFANYSDRVPTPDKPGPAIDFFYKGSSGPIGVGDTVEIPDLGEGATAYQPEPELAYVIGKDAKNVKEADAMDHVFGFVNFVDVSARGPGVQQRRTTFLHKGLEGWSPMGPVITTADEIADPHDLRVRLWLNEELQQDYSTSAMTHKIPEQIAWLSQYITLRPGDVISTGVHHKGLCNINDGDQVEVEIDGLERLAFSVKSYGPPKHERWRPPGTVE